jgi:hypothetical protein
VDPALTAALLGGLKERLVAEAQGANLPVLLSQEGFVELDIEVVAGCMRGAGLVRGLLGLDAVVQRALAEGTLELEAAERFSGELERAGDTVFAALTAVLVRARVPGARRGG